MRNLTTLILAAGAAALAALLARTQARVAELEAENTDLWHENLDGHLMAEQLRADLAVARQEAVALRADWEDAVRKLQRAREEAETAHGINRNLLDDQAAEQDRQRTLRDVGGYWTWAKPRHAPMGPFDDAETARAEAEALAGRCRGEPTYLLAAVDWVIVGAGEGRPVWDSEGRRHPVDVALAGVD